MRQKEPELIDESKETETTGGMYEITEDGAVPTGAAQVQARWSLREDKLGR